MEGVGQLGVGRGVDVRLHALADLGGELVGAREGEPDRGAGEVRAAGREGLLHGRGRRHHELRLAAAAAARRSSSPQPASRAQAATATSVVRGLMRPPLHHHRRGLHGRGRGHARRQAELLDGVAGDGGDHEVRAGLDLHERHHAVDLHGAHDAREAVARRERVPGVVAARALGETLDLGERHAAPVGAVANGAQLAGALPAPQRVGAHADRLARLAQEKAFFVGHCLSIT